MTSASRPAAWVIVPALAVLMGLQPVTTDLYLPALPDLQTDLHASMTGAQLTLSALLLSFGLSQLFIGPLTDRFGRRPLLLWGLALYGLAALGGALAPDIQRLVALRAVQGVGLAASLVCARAMVRDLFDPREGAHVMARALTGLGVIALAGPMVGALLASHAGWRATFVASAVFAALAWLLVALKIPETLAQPNPDATRARPLWEAWWRIMRHPAFRAWTLLIAFTYGAIYCFLAGSAFLYIRVLGTSRLDYGFCISAVTGTYILGTFFCQQRLRQLGLKRTVKRGAYFTLLGAAGLAGMALSGHFTPWSVTLASMAIAFGHGHHQPCAQAAVVGPFPRHAGTASALAGFLMSALAFGISAWLAAVMGARGVGLLGTQAAFAALTAWVAWTWVQRHGEAALETPRTEVQTARGV
jgi:DHA1 family bicyclomycin/chloramphenicol resistance-like MFS transporter